MQRFLKQYFRSYKSHLLAIDIGAYSIKLLEMKIDKGRPSISALGSIASPSAREGKLDEEELVIALNQLITTCSVSATEVITAISGTKVITRQIRLPAMPDQELAKAVFSEAQEHIPLPIDDLTVRYVKLSQEQVEQTNYLNVMLIAVPTALVEQYYHIFLMAGLKVTAMDLQAFGLWRLFGQEKDSDALAVADIGYSHSQLMVIKDGEIKFLRGMAEGGRTMNEAEGVDNLAREIKRSLSFYQSQPGSFPVSNMIFSGGSCNTNGFVDGLKERLEVNVEIKTPDCWNSFILDNPSIMKYDPSYAMALGLLMGEVPSNV